VLRDVEAFSWSPAPTSPASPSLGVTGLMLHHYASDEMEGKTILLGTIDTHDF
jgi:hypothetical protein